MLEIGCGWGGFAEFAAREIGCRVTGLTISREQHDFASAAHRQGRPCRQGRDQAAGLSRRDRQIRPHRLDRDVRGGRREILAGVLRQGEGLPARPAARAGMQIITINESAYPTYRKRPDFIQRYVFPGRHAADAGDPEIARRRARACRSCASASSRRTMRARWPNGASASGRHGTRSCRSASTTASRSCGSSISTIAKRASAPSTSTCAR